MIKTYRNTHNPILPPEYHIPDGEAHMMPDGKLYIYGSYDDGRAKRYCSEKYHVVSTPDMENWTIYEEALNGKNILWFYDPNAPKYQGIDWTNPTPFMRKELEKAGLTPEMVKERKPESSKPEILPPVLFAPDCIYKDGKYYLYFCMADDSEGVAVSDKPEGPFANPVQLLCGGIDPAIFIDEDGQAYYFWGQLFSHGVPLNDDMISFEQEKVKDNLVTEEEHFFHEGSSMRKIGDTYYYVYADMERGKPTSLGYATSKSPMGPFTYQGIIIDNDGCDPENWNNHGSIECVHGQWYVFYHRSSRGTRENRRLCIEPITIAEDGRIQEVKMTSQGPGTPFGAGEKMMGYQACGLTGTIYIGLNEDENTHAEYPEKLMNISAGDTAVFRYVSSSDNWNEITLKVTGSGEIRVIMNGKIAGNIKVKESLFKGIRLEKGLIDAEAGEYEVILECVTSSNLEIYELTIS